jgi:hypothetical protein
VREVTSSRTRRQISQRNKRGYGAKDHRPQQTIYVLP